MNRSDFLGRLIFRITSFTNFNMKRALRDWNSLIRILLPDHLKLQSLQSSLYYFLRACRYYIQDFGFFFIETDQNH